MGSIVIPQRRAVERVVQIVSGQALTLLPLQKYFLNNEEIFLRGISEGRGTCSDMRGINIAVFSGNPGDYRISEPTECWAAVFLRDRKDSDSDPAVKTLPNFSAVQGLMPDSTSLDPQLVRFVLTKKIALYPPM